MENIIKFSDFDKSWKPEIQKKTKRTDVGLDILKEKGGYSAETTMKLNKLDQLHKKRMKEEPEYKKKWKKEEEENEPMNEGLFTENKILDVVNVILTKVDEILDKLD